MQIEVREIVIDLSTTNSVVSYYDAVTVRTIKFDSESIVPSAIFFVSPEKTTYGKRAHNQRKVHPQSVIQPKMVAFLYTKKVMH